MNILVTGADGFIGRHLTSFLEAKGHKVIGIDKDDGDLRLSLAERGLESIIRSSNSSVVVHLAAQVGRVFGEDDIEHTISSNALMTARVARAAAACGARLVYASTSEVYGDQGEKECREHGPTVLPHNLYGLSKRWGEEVAALYAPRGLQILRLSMPYGPGLPAGRGRAAIINMLHQAHHRYEIPVHEGASRSWCWIGDTIAGIWLVIDRGERPDNAAMNNSLGVYNIGGNQEVTMLEVAEMACDIAGSPRDLIKIVKAPVNQTVVKRLGCGKLRSMGWRQTVELREGMERTYEFVKTLPA